jgi:two-component system, LytTR family, response regulator
MSTRLRAMVVDDEPGTLRSIVRLLKETGRVEVVGTATNGDHAVAFPRWAEVDVAFLDIVMPGMTGIELARRLPGNPLVVFITGYNEYAAQAFRLNAVDYLLKPIGPALLEEALTRLEGRLGDPTRQGARAMAEQVARYLQAGTWPGATGRLEHVGGRVGGSLKIVGLGEVTHFVTDDRLVFAVTPRGERYLVDLSLEDLERRLDPARFVRIHRACIVSLPHAELIPEHVGRDTVMRLKDGTELDVSRDRVRALRDRLGL